MNQFLDFIRENFWHIAPVLFMGFLGLLVFLERFYTLVVLYPIADQKVFFDKLRELILRNQLSAALELCEYHIQKPVAKVAKEALLRAYQPSFLIEHGLDLAVHEVMQKVNARTPYLATIANVATLMGLLGTIMGLVDAFQALGSASPQQKAVLLANGISTAMNATMIGLAVAIPCMIVFSFLMAKTNKLNSEIEQAAIRINDFIQQRLYEAETSIDARRKT